MANAPERRPTDRIVLVAAAALIDGRGRVLVQRRPPGKAEPGLWEFPGGKVEQDEAPAAALVRELYEELAVVVDERDLRPLQFTIVNDASRHLVLLLFACEQWAGEPKALHAERVAWYRPIELDALDLVPADRDLVDAVARLTAVGG